MPSSNWETLVVKRPISQISRGSHRNNRSASLTSASSSSSENNISVHSAPQRLQPSIDRYTKSSTPCLRVEPQKTQEALDSNSKSFKHRFKRRPLSSPTPSIDSSVSEEPERKTLVPIAPFLCRHAHSFASFETRNSEDKRQQQEELACRRETPNPWDLDRVQARGLKRRGSSLDSDSISSCSSSLDSRPASPVENFVKAVVWQTHLKPTKKVVLSSEAISKLRQGSCKLKLVRDSEGHTKQVKLVPSQTHTHSDSPSLSIISQDRDLSGESKDFDKNSQGAFTLGDLELNPVGNRQCPPFRGTSTHVLENHSASDINRSSTVSIQAHIDAINQHLAALSKAVDPAELSGLFPFASNKVEASTNSLQNSSGTSAENTHSSVSTNSRSFENICEGQQQVNSSTKSVSHEGSFECSELDEYFIDNFTL